MSEDTAIIKAKFKDKRKADSVFEAFSALRVSHQERMDSEQLLDLIGSLSIEAREILERPVRSNREDLEWLLTKTKDGHRRYLNFYFNVFSTISSNGNRIWMEQDDLADNLTPSSLEKKRGGVINISWMWGDRSHLGLSLMSAVFAALGAEISDAWVSYENGDPLGCDEDDFANAKSEVEVDLQCYFYPAVTEDQVRKIIPKKYSDFWFEEKSGYSYLSWLPLSRKDPDATTKVLKSLGRLKGVRIYANEFYFGTSHPYKWYRADGNSIELILDGNNYSKEEIYHMNHLNRAGHGGRLDWFSLDFMDVLGISDSFSLEDYANELVFPFRKERIELIKFHENIWLDNQGDIAPILKGLHFTAYYTCLEKDKVDYLVGSLIRAGMFCRTTEFSPEPAQSKCICGHPKHKSAILFIRNEIPEFKDYKIDLDALYVEDSIGINFA